MVWKPFLLIIKVRLGQGLDYGRCENHIRASSDYTPLTSGFSYNASLAEGSKRMFRSWNMIRFLTII